MNLRLPERIRAITPYEPGKPVETLLREYGVARAIKLASNENPLGPSPRALDAARRALAGVHLYPDGAGWALRARLAERLGVGMENVLLGAGSNEILDLVARVYLEPGDEAVMSARAFVIYRLATLASGARPVEVPMREETHDLDAMADAIGERTRIVFIANPNNPSGTRIDRAAWKRFLARVPDGVLVVMDEAYFEYARADAAYPDSLEGFAEDRAVLTLRTFSKAYGLAGLRIGYGIGPAEVIGALNRVRPPFNTSSVAQAAALAALEDEEHLAR
ncbi:MAG: aminotransferase class I/II-fold pyridoxal phosphate-dependent enzyme, partial [Myxococcales bacterium]|nr:aminotransferase class I/II-fold pyridoxal phosphate-dependent enzyme [Myxococcales bacterium]